jgi:hypothetical protein
VDGVYRPTRRRRQVETVVSPPEPVVQSVESPARLNRKRTVKLAKYEKGKTISEKSEVESDDRPMDIDMFLLQNQSEHGHASASSTPKKKDENLLKCPSKSKFYPPNSSPKQAE